MNNKVARIIYGFLVAVLLMLGYVVVTNIFHHIFPSMEHSMKENHWLLVPYLGIFSALFSYYFKRNPIEALRMFIIGALIATLILGFILLLPTQGRHILVLSQILITGYSIQRLFLKK